ncbi:hypothetical protein PQR21_20875 [Paraburkholderia nemoris]|jgi:hypothetical protein|uniref:hypothetical protein n=1 Tax=Paraburkholderia nemoris TaxID=2793076 RepID=UPI000FFBE1BC|nr:hypothetical protein [Paraburkholderia nemoris]
MPKFEVQVFESPEYATHCFQPVVHLGTTWDLSHLDSFPFKCDLGLGCAITVLVMFSCHCFSRSFARDGRVRAEIPSVEIYDDGGEQRVLDPVRYELSKKLLRDLVVTMRWQATKTNGCLSAAVACGTLYSPCGEISTPGGTR